MNSFDSDIASSLACLRAGGVLLYPTDTIWGLGCDPLHQQAVDRLFHLKGRPKDKSLILLAGSVEDVAAIVGEVPAAALAQVAAAGERPLTIVYPAGRHLAAGVAAADGSVAIRITHDPFCRALITAFGGVITSTSANVSGEPFGGSYVDVDRRIVAGVDYGVQWRQSERVSALPSRIIRVHADGRVEVIRP